MATLEAVLDESGSWISISHNYRPNKKFNMAARRPYWIHIIDLKSAQHSSLLFQYLDFLKWGDSHCFLYEFQVWTSHVKFQKPISKWPSWQPFWMNQGHEFQVCTTTGPTKFIALGFNYCIYCGSGGVAITRNSTWPPDGHFEMRYDLKKCALTSCLLFQ